MQTRPSLMLRKPASPSPEAIAAFIDKSEPEPPAPPVLQTAKMNDATPHLRAVPAEPEEPIITAAPIAKTRKPRPAAEEPTTSRVDAPSFRRASRAIAERRTKPARRRTTIYFDVDVASQLSAALIEHDLELSDAVNSAVKTWLRTSRPAK